MQTIPSIGSRRLRSGSEGITTPATLVRSRRILPVYACAEIGLLLESVETGASVPSFHRGQRSSAGYRRSRADVHEKTPESRIRPPRRDEMLSFYGEF